MIPRRRLAAIACLAAALGLGPAALAAGSPDTGTEEQRRSGKALYDRYCSQCHGEAGDGQGPAAIHLRPMPRDFTRGKYKIRTTPNGALPTHEDIRQIIRRGMPYSSMPGWPQFTDQQLSDLAYHVQAFSEDFASPDLVPDRVPLPPPPSVSEDADTVGRKAYEDSGCLRCHGNQGRGDGLSAPTLKDDWGHPIKPADLTQRWTFRGGGSRADIFRTISTGLNGTPMPSYFDALTEEQRWALTDYVASLSDEEPGYDDLVVARRLEESIDLEREDEIFRDAPAARLPVSGQIMEPGRSFYPPAVSILVQAVYDSEDLAVRVRWNDISAETTGHNDPALPVPPGEEAEPAPAGGEEAPAEGGDIWGEEAAPEAPADAGGDFWGEETEAAPSGPVSEFSDAVAIQWPQQMPSGARKPYFIFGDAGNPVDLWFMDLARTAPRQYTARGSADIAPNDTGDLVATARYHEGEWSVVFRRPLRPSSAGVAFTEGQFVPVAFSVWDGLTRERGNRRGLTLWYHLYVEPAATESPVGSMIKTAGAVLALEIIVIAWVRRRRRPGDAAATAAARVHHGPSAS